MKRRETEEERNEGERTRRRQKRDIYLLMCMSDLQTRTLVVHSDVVKLVDSGGLGLGRHTGTDDHKVDPERREKYLDQPAGERSVGVN
jgi:hypothetical protein